MLSPSLPSSPPPLSQFVLAYYLFQHGIRTLAELRLIDLIGAVRQCARYSSHVRVFGGLRGMLTPFHLTGDDEAAMLQEQANAE
jgi:hypothetical protein